MKNRPALPVSGYDFLLLLAVQTPSKAAATTTMKTPAHCHGLKFSSFVKKWAPRIVVGVAT